MIPNMPNMPPPTLSSTLPPSPVEGVGGGGSVESFYVIEDHASTLPPSNLKDGKVKTS